MSSLGQLIIHDQLHPSRRLALRPLPVQKADHAFKDDFVGHLSADRPELHLVAAEKPAQLLSCLVFNISDEICPLIKIDLFSFHGPVFGVAAGGVGDLKHLHQKRRSGFGWNKIKRLSLSPIIILDHSLR